VLCATKGEIIKLLSYTNILNAFAKCYGSALARAALFPIRISWREAL
jgi:hypothetical protein